MALDETFDPINAGPGPLYVINGGSPNPSVMASSLLNSNQHSLVAYSQYLATKVPAEDPVRTTERLAFMMTSAQAQTDTATDHVDRFLEHQGTQAPVAPRATPPEKEAV